MVGVVGELAGMGRVGRVVRVVLPPVLPPAGVVSLFANRKRLGVD